MRITPLIAIGALTSWTPLLLGQTVVPARGESATPAPALSMLPDAPEKALVVAHCETCHGLRWIERSGATEVGWNERIKRMIRAGSTIPRDQVPAVAAYLAKALPERPRPPKPAAIAGY